MNTRIAILYPEQRLVDVEQIQRWACDDLANEEGRHVNDWRTLPIEFALAIVDHYSVTLHKDHGYDLPDYTSRMPIPGVKFTYACEGHMPGPHDPMGETVYCDGTCRPNARDLACGQ